MINTSKGSSIVLLVIWQQKVVSGDGSALCLAGLGTNVLELIALKPQSIGIANEAYTWNCNS